MPHARLWANCNVRFLTLLGLALFLLAGCSGGSGTSSSAKRIIVLINGNSPYWDTCREGVKTADQELKLAEHNLRAVLEVNDGTPKGQIDKLRQYATQTDVAAVGISVTDAANAAIADEMRNLQAKGIHVLALDADVDREKFRDARLAFIGTDNLAAGRELGKAIAGLRPTGGELVTFVGRTGSQNAIERRQGVIEGAGAKFKAVDNMGDENDRTRAKENVRNAITNHKGLNVLVGIWSYNGPAIVDVVQQLNRRQDFTCVTFDAEPTTIEQMQAGAVDCMIVQNPFKIGYDGVKMMTALIRKDEATQREMFPDLKAPGGDLYDTGLKLVVPGAQSPLKAEQFSNKTEFLTLEQFKTWLAKYNLKGS